MLFRFCKRLGDIVLSLLAILLCSPLFLIISIAILATSKGPILFRQIRVGKNGKFFHCYKFRSMHMNAPQSPTSELHHANFYITRVGAFLRRFSLDELPQLFNVLRGDMSLIGPRPLIPAELPVHDLRLRYEVYRVRPGITGWAQIHGRDTVSAVRKAELDRYYIQNMGFLLDLKIVWGSVMSVVRHIDVIEGVEDVASYTQHLAQQLGSKTANLWSNMHHTLKAVFPSRIKHTEFEVVQKESAMHKKSA